MGERRAHLVSCGVTLLEWIGAMTFHWISVFAGRKIRLLLFVPPARPFSRKRRGFERAFTLKPDHVSASPNPTLELQFVRYCGRMWGPLFIG